MAGSSCFASAASSFGAPAASSFGASAASSFGASAAGGALSGALPPPQGLFGGFDAAVFLVDSAFLSFSSSSSGVSLWQQCQYQLHHKCTFQTNINTYQSLAPAQPQAHVGMTPQRVLNYGFRV